MKRALQSAATESIASHHWLIIRGAYIYICDAAETRRHEMKQMGVLNGFARDASACAGAAWLA